MGPAPGKPAHPISFIRFSEGDVAMLDRMKNLFKERLAILVASQRPYGLGTGSFATLDEARAFARVIAAHDGVANIYRWHNPCGFLDKPYYCTYSRPDQVSGCDLVERLTAD
jgi:hypothetical protein